MATNYEQSIVDAIDILIENAVSKAGFNRTVQANIIDCPNPNTGEYRVQYQDSTFTAYAVNPSTVYEANTTVYIMIPNNDINSSTKTILGPVNRNDVAYGNTDDAQFEVIGNNIIAEPFNFSFCSYGGDREFALYNEEYIALERNLFSINNTDFIKNINESNYLKVGFDLRTTIPAEQQDFGEYGIRLTLDYGDDLDDVVLTFSSRDFNGNPYGMVNESYQYKIFNNISTTDLISIKKVDFYSSDFYYTNEEITEEDILISNLSFEVMEKIELEKYTDFYINVNSPAGNTIKAESEGFITMCAELKTNNIVVPATKYEIYWFRENASIKQDSEKYNSYGGYGWECLNNYYYADSEKKDRRWITGDNYFSITALMSLTASQNFKCIIAFDNNSYEKEFTVYNEMAAMDIELTSTNGEFFFRGAEDTDIEVNVNDINDTDDYTLLSYDADFDYYWCEKDTAEKGVIDTSYFVKEDGNIHVITDLIDVYRYYICSVYGPVEYFSPEVGERVQEKVFIGSAKIQLFNSSATSSGDGYLSIVNGTQTFKYDNVGTSPCSNNNTYGKTQTIAPLSITLFSKEENRMLNGEQVLAAGGKINWLIPVENSMIVPAETYEIDNYFDTASQKFYFNRVNDEEFEFAIEDTYNYNYTDNDIIVLVHYNNQTYSAETNLIFLKDGTDGTNGSDYNVTIEPKYSLDDGVSKDHIIHIIQVEEDVAELVNNNDSITKIEQYIDKIKTASKELFTKFEVARILNIVEKNFIKSNQINKSIFKLADGEDKNLYLSFSNDDIALRENEEKSRQIIQNIIKKIYDSVIYYNGEFKRYTADKKINEEFSGFKFKLEKTETDSYNLRLYMQNKDTLIWTPIDSTIECSKIENEIEKCNYFIFNYNFYNYLETPIWILEQDIFTSVNCSLLKDFNFLTHSELELNNEEETSLYQEFVSINELASDELKKELYLANSKYYFQSNFGATNDGFFVVEEAVKAQEQAIEDIDYNELYEQELIIEAQGEEDEEEITSTTTENSSATIEESVENNVLDTINYDYDVWYKALLWKNGVDLLDESEYTVNWSTFGTKSALEINNDGFTMNMDNFGDNFAILVEETEEEDETEIDEDEIEFGSSDLEYDEGDEDYGEGEDAEYDDSEYDEDDDFVFVPPRLKIINPDITNIIKAEVSYNNGTLIYAAKPIITTYMYDSFISITPVEDSGFRSVLYNTDGTMPQYDTTSPFEIKAEIEDENIYAYLYDIFGEEEDNFYANSDDDDINNFEMPDSSLYYYNEDTQGEATEGEYVDTMGITIVYDYMTIGNNLSTEGSDGESVCYIEPAKEFLGSETNNAVVCFVYAISPSGRITYPIGWIHIPIYMSLNRYGLGFLNGWDGNSVEVADGHICAPVMGAGKKEHDNSFTGVVMGTVATSADGESDETGLFGYSYGNRSFTLDAKTGKATFGPNETNGIVINPAYEYNGNTITRGEGYIAGGYKKGDGLIKDDDGYSNEGLKIAFYPEPYIVSPNFRIDRSGSAYFKGDVDAIKLNLKTQELVSEGPKYIRSYEAESTRGYEFSDTEYVIVIEEAANWLEPPIEWNENDEFNLLVTYASKGIEFFPEDSASLQKIYVYEKDDIKYLYITNSEEYAKNMIISAIDKYRTVPDDEGKGNSLDLSFSLYNSSKVEEITKYNYPEILMNGKRLFTMEETCGYRCTGFTVDNNKSCINKFRINDSASIIFLNITGVSTVAASGGIIVFWASEDYYSNYPVALTVCNSVDTGNAWIDGRVINFRNLPTDTNTTITGTWIMKEE